MINKNFFSYLNKVLYLDLRSLAIFRIGLGLISLYNLLCLYPHINTYYGSNSIAPLESMQSGYGWSVYGFSDNVFIIRILFVLHALFAMMLVVGYRTKLATIACFIMTASLIHRAPILAYGADKVLKVFLMWGAFLPLGARFSLDQNRHGNTLPNHYFSMATIAFIAQLIIIYTFNALAKTDASWTKTHTALYYVFNNFEFAKPLGSFLLQFPTLLKWLTALTLLLEMYGFCLLLIPKFSSFFRSMACVIFMVFHVTIFLCMDVGWLPVMMIIVWFALIPSSLWDRIYVTATEKNHAPKNIVLKLVVALLLLYVFVLNLRYVAIHSFKKPWRENIIEDVSKYIGLYQKWSLFTPAPSKFTTTYYYTPIFENEFLNTHPTSIQIENKDRWVDFLGRLQKPEFRGYIIYLRDYLIQEWNRSHREIERIRDVRIYPIHTPIPNPK